jgi:hypothetical protein
MFSSDDEERILRINEGCDEINSLLDGRDAKSITGIDLSEYIVIDPVDLKSLAEKFPFIVKLDLSSSMETTFNDIKGIAFFVSLIGLGLSGDTDLDPKRITKLLSTLPHLRKLNLSCQEIPAKYFNYLSSITDLDFSNNLFDSEEDFKYLSELKSIRKLNLSSSTISSRPLDLECLSRYLRKCPTLISLDLSGNGIVSTKWLQNVYVDELNISHNDITQLTPLYATRVIFDYYPENIFEQLLRQKQLLRIEDDQKYVMNMNFDLGYSIIDIPEVTKTKRKIIRRNIKIRNVMIRYILRIFLS